MESTEAKRKCRLASSLCGNGKNDEALPLLDELSDTFPHNKDILFARGLCLSALKRFDEARVVAEKLEIVFSDPRGAQLKAEVAELAAQDDGKPERTRGGHWRILLGAIVAILSLVTAYEVVERAYRAVPDGVFLVRKDVSADTTPDGRSWSSAFWTIQEAIDAAHAFGGGEVWVAHGVYDEPRDPETGALFMRDGVELYGGFRGKEKKRTKRDPENLGTIIDGRVARQGMPAYHVVNSAPNCVIDGVTIQGGYADGSAKGDRIGGGVFNGKPDNAVISNCIITSNYAAQDGGGLWNHSDELIVRNCIFRSNTAGYGAGMYNFQSSPSMEECTFQSNKANSEGGGMFNSPQAEPHIEGCTFEGNSAEKHGGGAVHNHGASPTIIQCRFMKNLALGSGGGIQNVDTSAKVTIVGCLFEDNQAVEWDGGGIHNWNGASVRVEQCTFRNNVARHGGGMYIGMGSNATVLASTFSRCPASALGGAVAVFRSSGYFENCVIAGNSVQDNGGGACVWENASAEFVNCTFFENQAQEGGVSVGVWNASVIEILNSIVWSDGPVVDARDTSGVSIAYSNVRGGYRGTGNIDSDPQFVNPSQYNLHLRKESPSIDSATPSRAPGVDMDGVRRPTGAGVDMGAYEQR